MGCIVRRFLIADLDESFEDVGEYSGIVALSPLIRRTPRSTGGVVMTMLADYSLVRVYAECYTILLS